MKSEKGITLMVLMIYVIVLCFVIGILATVSSFFYSNTSYLVENSEAISEYNKFNMYFIEDVKNNKDIDEITDHRIVFSDGTTYTYKKNPDNSIYRNKVKICSDVAYCSFSNSTITTNEVEKKLIQVYMIIKGAKLFETNNEYVLRYW